MYTRKINLKELILELDCLDESTVEALENTETGIESYEVEYSVTHKGEDDYEVLPTPSDVGYDCVAEFYGICCKYVGYMSTTRFFEIMQGIRRDAEWWEGENRDMLIELSEDRFEDE